MSLARRSVWPTRLACAAAAAQVQQGRPSPCSVVLDYSVRRSQLARVEAQAAPRLARGRIALASRRSPCQLDVAAIIRDGGIGHRKLSLIAPLRGWLRLHRRARNSLSPEMTLFAIRFASLLRAAITRRLDYRLLRVMPFIFATRTAASHALISPSRRRAMPSFSAI